MTNEEIYDFIGELAIALYSKKVQISLGALRAIMLDKGKDYVNNRGMASAVSAAYRRWKTKDPIIYYAIAYTYTDREGNLAWDEPKQDKKKVKPTDEKPISPDENAEEKPETSEPECTEQECQDPQPELDLSVEEKPEEETPAETATEEITEEKPEEPPAKEEKKAAPKKKTGTKKAPAKKK